MNTHAFVYLNGRIVPVGRARLSVWDRGVLYGDGLFETVRAYRGVPFMLDAHLQRLRRSAEFLGLRLPVIDWRAVITRLLHRCGAGAHDVAVRLTVTRGAACPSLLPPADIVPTYLITVAELDPLLPRVQRRGARVTLLPFARHGFLAEHKILDYLPAILGRTIARQRGAFEALFVERRLVREGTTTNLFIRRDGRLLTPPAVGILPGVTRQVVMQLAAAAGHPVHERSVRVADIETAVEAFVTSSLAEVVPIIAIDDAPVGGGRVGPLTREMQRGYQALARRAGRAD